MNFRSILCPALLICCATAVAHAETDVATLLKQADSLVSQANYDSALAIELVALTAAEQQYGADDTLVAKVLMYIGTELCGFGRFDEACERWERALAIRKLKMGPDHPRVADCQMNLGIAYQRRQMYDRAEAYFQSARKTIIRAFGLEHERSIIAIQNLFGFYWHVGNLDSASAYAERAAALSRVVFGPDRYETAVNQGNLAVFQIELKQLDLAERNLEEAVAVLERIDSTPAIELQLALFLNNLGNVYSSLEKHERALAVFVRALETREKYLGPDHPDVAVSLGNLASTYLALGKWEEAERMNLRALASLEKFYGKDHAALAHVLVNLGVACRRLQKLDESRQYYERALDLRTRAFGRRHPLVATVVYNLGALTAAEGKPQEAIALVQEALEIREGLFGDRNPDVAECLEQLSHLYRRTGQYRESLAAAVRAESIRRQHLYQMTAALAEREALAFSISHRQALGHIVAAYFESPPEVQKGFESPLIDALISSKGLITDQMSQVYRWAARASDSLVVGVLSEMQAARLELSDLYVKGPTDSGGLFRARVDSLQLTIDDCESRLIQASDRFGRDMKQMSCSADDLIRLLPDNAHLIEYFRIDLPTRLDAEKYDHAYLALVLHQSSPSHILHLGPAERIDSLARDLHSHLRTIARVGSPDEKQTADYLSLSRSLSTAILGPLSNVLPDSGLLVFAPDGALNTVSFAALPLHPDAYLIESHAVQYLSAGRDLLRFDTLADPGTGLLALGNPDFNAELETADATAGEANGPVLRQVSSDCSELRDLLAHPLPASEQEVETVTQLWQSSEQSPAVILTGTAADEGSFKKLAIGKLALHLATHGFFVGQSCGRDRSEGAMSRLSAGQRDNPLLFSGLLLAGANSRLFGGSQDDSTEDGLLTALEVSTLDLTGTRLAVLSACETGLGTVENGEGLFGLKRAFHLAGVSTVVSSLWSVPDQATAEILGELYAHGDDLLPFRLRDLQTSFIDKARKQGRSDHPFTWAAFTIQGNWHTR